MKIQNKINEITKPVHGYTNVPPPGLVVESIKENIVSLVQSKFKNENEDLYITETTFYLEIEPQDILIMDKWKLGQQQHLQEELISLTKKVEENQSKLYLQPADFVSDLLLAHGKFGSINLNRNEINKIAKLLIIAIDNDLSNPIGIVQRDKLLELLK